MFVYTEINVKTVLFQTVLSQTVQFSISIQFQYQKHFYFKQFGLAYVHSSILLDRTLIGATIPGQSGPESDGNERVLRIPQSSSLTEASPSDCFVSYPGHSLGESYPSTETQSVYSAVPADWDRRGYLEMLKTTYDVFMAT